MKKLLLIILIVALLLTMIPFSIFRLPASAATVDMPDDISQTLDDTNKEKQNKWFYDNGIWYYYDSNGDLATGWQLIDNFWYFMNGDGVMLTGWQLIDGTWYYFNASGAMQTGWLLLGNTWYYLSNGGAMVTDWQLIDNIWYYFNAGGAMQTGWQLIGGTWYYMNNSGAMQTGWLELEEARYYFNQSGEMQIGWVTVENRKYLFDKNGGYVEGAHTFVIDVSKWQGNIDWDKISESDVDAIILRSSHGGNSTENYGNSKDSKFDEYLENINRLNIPYGIYHYNTATTVESAENQAQNVINILKDSGANPTLPVFVDIEQDGDSCDLISIAKVYISKFISNGYKPGIYANENYWKNYLNDPNFNAYYKWIANYGTNNGFPSATFAPKDGIESYMMWQYTSVGKLDAITENTVDFNALFDWYIKPDGWQEIFGKRYHYSNGYLKYGWFFENNNWYYLKSSGEMAVGGWEYIGENWYYFNEHGVMQTGWIFIDETWYYLKDGGAMQTGWLLLGNTWYYLSNSGAMVTDWQLIDGTWYYFNASGAMQTGWQLIGGTWYYMNNSGAMVTDWLLIGGTWYYFNAGGAMQTGWQLIGDTWYYFDASGAWIS